MKRKLFIIILGIIILFGVASCKRFNLLDPESFKHFEGTLVHYYGKILIVKSSLPSGIPLSEAKPFELGKEMRFRVGRNTVFIPKESYRMRDFLNIGDRFNIRYLIKPYSHRNIGTYFIAFEVRNIGAKRRK